jgi:predicted alpha/beta hydrolase family esterase
MYDFFTMYAEVDGWEYEPKPSKTKVVILHGTKGDPNENWFSWLADKLRQDGYEVFVPEFPTPENQSLENWRKVFDKEVPKLDENTILIGHSLGATFILDILNRAKTPIGKAIFASGFTNKLGDDEFDNLNKTFVEQDFGWAKIRKNAREFVVFHGDNDPYVPQSEAENIAGKLGVKVNWVKNGGHLNEAAGYTKFVELYEKIKSQNTPTISLADLTNPLDKWIVSRVHELRNHITKYLDEYNLPDAMSAILPMIDDASNWYVRRSRRRFWKSEDDGDKNDAYRTLHYVLAYLSQILAPFVPFLAEELYQKLTGGESVHLLDWPEASEIDEKVLSEMAHTREIIEKGLALRMDREDEFGQIKVRQPLAKLTYGGEKLDDFYEQIIADEVNVKAVIASEAEQSSDVLLDKKITPELRREGQAREVIRLIQNARKEAGLNVDDRIVVDITTDDKDLKQAIEEFGEVIATETLATKFASNDGYKVVAKIDEAELTIQLKKEA